MNPTPNIPNNKPTPRPDLVKDYLDSIAVSVTITHQGTACPPFCEDIGKPNMGFPRKNHIHGDAYQCTISRPGKAPESFQYWGSFHDAERNWLIAINARMGESNRQDALLIKHGADPKRAQFWTLPALRGKAAPNVTDIIACIERRRPEDYDYWCNEFGYDTDSRKALSVWEACNAQYRQMSRMFSPAELAKLDEILQDY